MGSILLSRSPTLAAFIVAIFVALFLLQFAASRLGESRSSAATAYSALGQALHDGAVLPLGSLDEMRAALRTSGAGEMLPDPQRINSFIAVNGSWHFYIHESSVLWLEINPQQWQDFPRGAIAQALKRISRADYYTQAQAARRAQGLRVAPDNFSFAVSSGGQDFEMTPVFEAERCVLVRISRPMLKNP
jgi:hypothetical protein